MTPPPPERPKDYTSTLMRIAGNVAGAIYADHARFTEPETAVDLATVARESVRLARLIVQEILPLVASEGA